MRDAIRQGNKNISLTTMGLKRKARTGEASLLSPELSAEAPITGNPHAFGSGLANNLGNIDLGSNNPLGLLIL